jgi:hypothetical protein
MKIKQMKRDNTIRNLVASLEPVFKQDEQMARGKFKGLLASKAPKPCAPHHYKRKQDANGEYWQCDCGQIITNNFFNNIA